MADPRPEPAAAGNEGASTSSATSEPAATFSPTDGMMSPATKQMASLQIKKKVYEADKQERTSPLFIKRNTTRRPSADMPSAINPARRPSGDAQTPPRVEEPGAGSCTGSVELLVGTTEGEVRSYTDGSGGGT